MSGGRPSANRDLLNLLGMTLSNPDPNVPGGTLGPSNELSAPRVLYLYRQNNNIINPPRHMLGDTYRFNNELYTIIRGAQVPSVGEYVYEFKSADGYTSAQTESAILAGDIGEPMPINTSYIDRLQLNVNLRDEILLSMNIMPTMSDPAASRINAEMPCRRASQPRESKTETIDIEAKSDDWGPIGVDPRWNTSTRSEIVDELQRNSPDHMSPENIMFRTFISSLEVMPRFLLGDLFQIGVRARSRVTRLLVVSGVKIGDTWFYELYYSTGGRGIYITQDLERFTQVYENADLSEFGGNKDLIREQYSHPLSGIRMGRIRRENAQRTLEREGSPAASPIRTPPRSSAAAPPPAPRVRNRISAPPNPVSSQAAAEARRKPSLLLGDLFQHRERGTIFIVINGRWSPARHGLDPAEYTYDLINKQGERLVGWSKRQINRFFKPVPGSRSAAAVVHPLVEFPISDEKRTEITNSRIHQQERMSGWISRPRARRRLLYNVNSAHGDPSPVFAEQQLILNGDGNASKTPVINKLALNLINGRSHPANPPPPDLQPGSGVKYDPRYLFGEFFKKGDVYFVVMGGEWINGEWVYVLMGSDRSMHRHTESQIAQMDRDMPDGSIQPIPAEERLVGVTLGREQDEDEFDALVNKFSFALGYEDDMWWEREQYQYQRDELFLKGKQAREHTSPNEESDKVLEERYQQFYRNEQKRRSDVAKAHGDNFYVKKRLDDDLKAARKPIIPAKTRSGTRRRQKARKESIAAAKERKENYESREGSKQLATGQAAINAKAKAWWEQNKEEHVCTICFDGFDDDDVNYTENGKLFYAVQLRCGHWFHYNCIKMSQKPKTGPIDYQWARDNVRQRKFMDTLMCPICRTPAVDDSFGDGVYRLINLRF